MNTKGLRQIGKGAFSTVYKKTADKVLIESTDKVKECMSLGWFPKSKLFPIIKYVGANSHNDLKFYECKFYEKICAVKPNLTKFDYEFYRVLRNLPIDYQIHPYASFKELHRVFDTVPNKFHSKRRALKDALDALSNYGPDIGFEISPRNIAIENKRLVLLDCFFIKSDLKQRS